jgi:hypothetical protein
MAWIFVALTSLLLCGRTIASSSTAFMPLNNSLIFSGGIVTLACVSTLVIRMPNLDSFECTSADMFCGLGVVVFGFAVASAGVAAELGRDFGLFLAVNLRCLVSIACKS